MGYVVVQMNDLGPSTPGINAATGKDNAEVKWVSEGEILYLFIYLFFEGDPIYFTRPKS